MYICSFEPPSPPPLEAGSICVTYFDSNSIALPPLSWDLDFDPIVVRFWYFLPLFFNLILFNIFGSHFCPDAENPFHILDE